MENELRNHVIIFLKITSLILHTYIFSLNEVRMCGVIMLPSRMCKVHSQMDRARKKSVLIADSER